MHWVPIESIKDFLINDNPDALSAWMQELVCRTFSLQQLGNSMSGWKLLGPTGQQCNRGWHVELR